MDAAENKRKNRYPKEWVSTCKYQSGSGGLLFLSIYFSFMDWSLLWGGGGEAGLQNGRGASEVFTPTKRGPDGTSFRDWSLITGRGGATKREGGGACEVLPPRKGGSEKVLAMLKGGHNKFWGSNYAVAGSFSHIVEGARKSFHSLKGGA